MGKWGAWTVTQGGRWKFRTKPHITPEFPSPYMYMGGYKIEWRRVDMTKKQINDSARRIVANIVEAFNDKPGGKPSPQVVRALVLFGPKERARAAADIVALVEAAGK